ncbi:serine/threonine-protein kinase [Streptomyces sp. NPDC059785]|uniref:serine/threonine-protein kinase n=1 Tax=Streptomyces sp. NPDC059785 TaxID=3346945 RepID=UPI003656908E
MEKLGAGDPQRIGDYRLLARLGAGGMGQVFLARSARGRTVAVKLVRRELAEREEFRARFRQEVQAARRVGGHWTAPVLDADTEAPVPWVATGYVAGPTLGTVVGHDHGALPERSVRILAAGLAHALRDIHAAGLIHRDLKPSNVLVTIDGPRVIDFGIARALQTVTDSGLTRTGALVGSPGFMAPEQIRGDRITPACDVFCLGSVLVYAATGKLPFGSADSGVHALMFRIAQEEPDLTGLPESLTDLVRDCLHKDPAARPALDRILERTGAEDTVSGGRTRDPWLPSALVAQLGRHAVQLLDTEDPDEREEPGARDEPRERGVAGASGVPGAPGAPGVTPAGAEAPTVSERPGAAAATSDTDAAAAGAGTGPGAGAGATAAGAGTGAAASGPVGNPVGAPVGHPAGHPAARPDGAPSDETPPEHATAPDAPDAVAPPAAGQQAPHGHRPTYVNAAAPGRTPPPAYGYPQQHPQHPSAQHPNPYAQPQPPGYGYGYPQGGPSSAYAPQGPHAPQPPQPERRSGRSTAALVAVALVVALGAGGSVYALMNNGTGGGRADNEVSPEAGTSASPEPGPTTAASGSPSPTATPTATAAGGIPEGYLGTWSGSIDSGAGHSTRQLVIQQGEVGDAVLTLVAEGPADDGTYHCEFRAELTGEPAADGPLEIGPSEVVVGEPATSCTPGAASQVTLLPDGRLRRVNTQTGEELTYTKE